MVKFLEYRDNFCIPLIFRYTVFSVAAQNLPPDAVKTELRVVNRHLVRRVLRRFTGVNRNENTAARVSFPYLHKNSLRIRYMQKHQYAQIST